MGLGGGILSQGLGPARLFRERRGCIGRRDSCPDTHRRRDRISILRPLEGRDRPEDAHDAIAVPHRGEDDQSDPGRRHSDEGPIPRLRARVRPHWQEPRLSHQRQAPDAPYGEKKAGLKGCAAAMLQMNFALCLAFLASRSLSEYCLSNARFEIILACGFWSSDVAGMCYE
jgi:hypothetical protein